MKDEIQSRRIYERSHVFHNKMSHSITVRAFCLISLSGNLYSQNVLFAIDWTGLSQFLIRIIATLEQCVHACAHRGNFSAEPGAPAVSSVCTGWDGSFAE